MAQSPTANDPVLAGMQAELNRSRQELQLQNMQRPFFIEYRLEDVQVYEATAGYGALMHEQTRHQRILRVTVSVGDYKSDSSITRGDGAVQLATSDDDPAALRYEFWSATDTAYKNALRIYSDKQAALKGFQTPPTADDFSQEKPVVHIAPLVKLDLDRAAWKQRITDASGLYATDPATSSFAQYIQYSAASIRGLAVNRYTVNTEGTVLRQGYTAYQAAIGAGTQAADGMRLDRSYTSTAVTQTQLDDWAKFKKGTIGILLTLRDLRNAPVVADEYHGPVLFSGDASADVIASLFTPNIAADKPNMGTTARMQGVFSSSYKTRVMPEFMSVTDDPTMQSYHGIGLLGAYAVDDEGVPAQAVNVVTKGILTNYLIGRRPVKDFPHSNGHGRAAIAQAAQSTSGVLIVKSSEPLSSAAMEQKLLSMGKDQGLNVVYEVDTLGPELTPRLLYRVHPADGKRELVRGAVFDDLDQRSLRSDIVAAGDDSFLSNVMGRIPTSAIVPSLLIDDISVKRATQQQEKLPYYPSPDAAKNAK
ncbi:MAG: metallopeptidase TldD-related protein [Acidobacteriaceae bacterium]